MSERSKGWLKRNGKIFKLISLTGLDEVDMRAKLKDLTGKTSRADLTEKDQEKFLDWLQSLTPVRTQHAASRPKGRPRGPKRDDRHIVMATVGQKEEIKRTFFEILGWDEARVNGMIVRVSRGTSKSIDTLSLWAAANMIEAGKNMKKRASVKALHATPGRRRQHG